MTPSNRQRPFRVGRYELLFPLGAGGMAEVFAARISGEAGFQKLVALKRMYPNMTASEELTAMFLDESRIAAAISSPHVVSTLDLGRADDGSLFLVMELINGVSLSYACKRLQEGFEPPARITALLIEFMAQAADGLHDAHEARTPEGTPLGIVHRDVSPQNILLGVDGRARLSDFGVARAVLRTAETSTGQLKGKYAYFSPEQAQGNRLGRRSDVFSLGIVAWEALTGNRLFKDGVDDNPLKILNRVLADPIPNVCDINPEIPRSVGQAIAEALQRNPDQRTPTAAAFSLALRSAAQEHYSLPNTRELADFVSVVGAPALSLMQENLRRAYLSREKDRSLPYLSDSERTASVSQVERGTIAEPGRLSRELNRPWKTSRRYIALVITLVIGGAGLWLTYSALTSGGRKAAETTTPAELAPSTSIADPSAAKPLEPALVPEPPTTTKPEATPEEAEQAVPTKPRRQTPRTATRRQSTKPSAPAKDQGHGLLGVDSFEQDIRKK
jgi:serine/threonine protein kinase